MKRSVEQEKKNTNENYVDFFVIIILHTARIFILKIHTQKFSTRRTYRKRDRVRAREGEEIDWKSQLNSYLERSMAKKRETSQNNTHEK